MKYVTIPGIRTLTLLIGICLLAGPASAQDTSATEVFTQRWANSGENRDPNPEITLTLDDVPLREALKRIADQARGGLYYNAELLPEKKVTLRLQSMPLGEALQEVLEGTSLNAVTSGRNISLRMEKEPRSIQQSASDMQETITGTVTDAQSGEPLPGVNILVKGTTTGTSTDASGNYELSVESLKDTLVASFVGYQTQEIPINGRTTISVELQAQAISGEEMVVVGYGTQEKRDVTGAVSQISSDEIRNRPMTNISQGLQGISPNVNIDLTSGKPIESPDINIRGATSIGQGGDALVLIDGTEGDPSMLNPKDIETISVLKGPAASAQYGARAAFGVVQITTRDATNKEFTINIDTHIGFKKPAVEAGFVSDGYTYVKNFNKAYQNALGTVPKNINKTQPFSLEYLKEFKKRHEDPSLPVVEVNDEGDYVYYSSTDWYDKLYKDKLMTQEYNFSASAGNERANFIVSGRYNGQGGLFRYNSDDFKVYNFRGKGEIKLFSWLTLSNNVSYAKRIFFNPLNVGEGGGIWRNIQDEGHPSAPMLNPDGTITFSGVYTVGDFYYGKNGKEFNRQIIDNKTQLEGEFFDGKLTLTGDFSYKNTSNDISEKRVPVPYSKSPDQTTLIGTDQNSLALTKDNTDYYSLNFYGEYQNTFIEKHNLDVTIGTNYERQKFDHIYLRRNGLAFSDADNINLALGEGITTNGGYNAWNILGMFYQLNYNFDHRYLFTLSGRYDGNSRFPEDQRFGFFPSFSAGWAISEEPFWDVSQEILSELKVRASYGSLGNGNISPYTYQEQLPINKITNVIDGEQPQAISNPAVLPAGLTWETVTTGNIGVDLAMFSNKLSLSADAYIRNTTDMFTKALTPPRVFGAGTPKGNYADLRTTGWELSLSWTDNINDVAGKEMGYKIGVNLSDNKAEITKFNNPNKNLNDYYEGQILGEVWGYVNDGLFQSEKEIENHANQNKYLSPSSPDGNFRVGDLKYKDLNGDGVINDGDNRVNSPGDRRIIGNSHPRYRFGINFNVNWGGFFVSGLFQGVGKRDWYPSSEADYFWGQYNRPYNHIPKWQLKDGMVWSKDKPHAFLPKYTGYEALNSALANAQNRYLMNVAYIRLKNLQIGYNFSQESLSKLGIKRAQIYLNGQNLWRYSPLHKTAPNIDPESGIAESEDDVSGGGAGDGLNYPILRSFSLGVSLTF